MTIVSSTPNPLRRGRKPGSVSVGSVHAQVAAMQVGDAFWIETTADKYGHVQREWNPAATRRPECMKDFVIECSVWRAVPAHVTTDTRILVRVERVK